MNEIKSLADQLREKLRTGEKGILGANAPEPPPSKTKKPAKKPSGDSGKAEAFFRAIDGFKLEGTEKSLIRVDKRTMHLLKRMKLAKGIDMNRFIVFALHSYIQQHPWLPGHIQETLKNSEP
ncbi:hypothetical protein [Elizabethkingia anophelis]|uniref:hypothetical protein n=1 Tax=Elizabethkingia anophelis TaxID=1117645 RepID=UPI0012B211F9|nr:hypothetical protein [Elizabethkingia anophelis]QGN22533.1 hypothetical protein GJV56_07780 [Elizabethkingia anophelis]QNV09185.1 hypothetical protein EIY88_07760 [Elizabethkingia anophelis]UTF90941.1 hypothetical protein J2N93_07825 [Elizabethkingia anophelis]UTG01811.1 hypothetical protein J2O04_07830 [Elizabethkingia anophelis]UTG05561.1 hypothetical protein J2O03_07825 [Elizabethkingia anophelis]